MTLAHTCDREHGSSIGYVQPSVFDATHLVSGVGYRLFVENTAGSKKGAPFVRAILSRAIGAYNVYVEIGAQELHAGAPALNVMLNVGLRVRFAAEDPTEASALAQMPST